MDKLTKREQQAIHSKQKIIDSCKQLIQTMPWEEIKISDICEVSHLSVGAFYHYFKNKSEILVLLDQSMDHYFYDQVLPECLCQPPEDGLLCYLCHQTEFYKQYGITAFKTLYKAQLDNTRYVEELHQRYFVKGIYALLENAKLKNVLDPQQDLTECVQQLLAVNYGIYYFWCLMDDCIDIDTYAKTILSHYLSSLFHNDMN